MNHYKAVLFDLDGTLADSLEDIADAMNQTLKQFGYPVFPTPDYRYFVGTGLRNLVIKCLPEDKKADRYVDETLAVLMTEYGKNVLNKTVLYPGIPELLDVLKQKKYKLAVLSNKADILTQQIAQNLLSKWSFDIIMGVSDRFPRKPDPKSALYIAETLDIDKEQFLYLGDTGVDMQTANAAGMFPIGVTWGFRKKEELIDNGARLIIDKPQDLISRL
ncbi:HAD family hydrolase [Bacteroidales bacterium OttesenSCG-928-A17]|nr:HAD family hydrolase [Bacteroidales bacterium OttesenSCG-928-A17]